MRSPITNNPGFEIAALVNRSDVALPPELSGYAIRRSFEDALRDEKPDVASINTYSDSHADYAVKALEAGCHVFVEKPLATTVADAERVVAAARANGRKLVIGYILRHHPSWMRLIAEARKLGGPYVFRMNLNQQSSGPTWETHKQLMQTTSPIVDCGVHYVDVMCQITDARPVEVRGMGLRLTEEIDSDHVQLRPSAGAVRGRLGRLVRGRLGTDDLGDRLLREGRDLAERLRLDRHGRGRQVRRHRHAHQDLAHPHPRAATGADGKFAAARRDAVDAGRARPSGALRPRAGLPAEGDPRGYRPRPATWTMPCSRSPSALRRRERAHRPLPVKL